MSVPRSLLSCLVLLVVSVSLVYCQCPSNLLTVGYLNETATTNGDTPTSLSAGNVAATFITLAAPVTAVSITLVFSNSTLHNTAAFNISFGIYNATATPTLVAHSATASIVNPGIAFSSLTLSVPAVQLIVGNYYLAFWINAGTIDVPIALNLADTDRVYGGVTYNANSLPATLNTAPTAYSSQFAIALNACPLAAAATITGDPVFVGFAGQRYQIHGINGAAYAVLSTANVFVNARLEYLHAAQCTPAVAARTACFTHDGNYITNIVVGARNKTIIIRAGKHDRGLNVTLVPATSDVHELSVIQRSAYAVDVVSAEYEMSFINSDGFINYHIAMTDRLRAALPNAPDSTTPHGLLGQTWADVRYRGRIPFIQGTIDDYVITSADMRDSEFAFDRFRKDDTSNAQRR